MIEEPHGDPAAPPPDDGDLCSAAWLDDVRAGERYPDGMRACPACERRTPPIYFAAGVCLDCAAGIPVPAPASEPAAPPARKPPAWYALVTMAERDPAAFARGLASLTERERAAVELVASGTTAAAAARAMDVSAPVACLALGRAVRHFHRLGMLDGPAAKIPPR